MAALRYKDEHNKVGYLLKPTGSDDYHHITDFLRASHIRDPELGPLAILATIDKTPYTITKDLVRSRLQLPMMMVLLIYPLRKYILEWIILGHPMPLLPAMLLQAQAGEGAEVAAQAVPQPVPVPDQPSASLSTPSRQQTSDPIALVLEHGQSSGSHTASFSQSKCWPFYNCRRCTYGRRFPYLSTKKVHLLESELKDHKKLFKDVVGKLVKKDGDTQDMDLDALRALANAAMTIDSIIPFGGTSHIPAASLSVSTAVPPGTSDVPLGTSAVPTGASTVPAGSPNVPIDIPSSAAPTCVSSKAKSPMVEEDIPIKARTFKQMEEDRLEVQRKRQQDIIDSTMYYNEADWLNNRAQVEANASLSKTLLGDDVSKDNFPARMAVLIKRKRHALAKQLAKERHNRPMTQAQQKAYMRQYVKNQSSVIYNTGWIMAYVKSFTDDQLKQEFKKICKVQSNSQIQAVSITLKRSGLVLEAPSSKRKQSTEALIPSVVEVPHSPAISSPLSSHTRRKSLGQKHIHKPKSTLPKLDLDADAQTFVKVVVNEDSDDEDSNDEVWSAVVDWEVLPTPLGEINALYHIDGSTKHFTTLRQILHMLDRKDLVKLYGLVVQYYENHPVAGAGLIFWDVSYPLSVNLMERMLMHKLEIDSDVVGNDMTTAEQLIQLIKNQLVAAQASSV
nr:JmjC domain-containing protein [Tanacetum cinerariifolium]